MKDLYRYFDKFSFLVLLILTIIGIFLIYSASHGLSYPFYAKQLIWLGVSLCFFFLFFFIRTDNIFHSAYFFYSFFIVILLFQLAFGMKIAGTKSWIRLGSFSIQFSEWVKIPLALIIARILAKTRIIDWKTFFKIVFFIGFPFLLIAKQPDFGTASILLVFLIGSFLLRKTKKTIIFVSIIFLISGSGVVWKYMLKPYQKNRIISFLNPGKYKQSIGYQIIQSKIAIGSGGLNGKGLLKGSQSEYRFLPTQQTDFILSVLGEEFGFLGVCTLLTFFFILLYRQFSSKTENEMEFFFVILFNGLILCQFLVNVLMAIGWAPVLGVPLPFISYGGSSLLSFFIGEAIIFRIKINSFLS